MQISFPAMEGVIGGRKYYSCLMKLSAVPKMFTFRDWAEFTPEQREQRVLNKRRVPEIAKYILENEDGYLFSSITASYKCDVNFVSNVAGSPIGELKMEFEDANFVINDGQHRCAGITAAIAENKSLGDEMISVLLFPYEDLGRVQQMFSDLNSNVSKTSKSLDILYDKRDPYSRVALEVVERVPVFNSMVDMDAISLPVRSPKLFTLSAIFDATKEMIGELGEEEGDLHYNEAVSRAIEFWAAVSKMIPLWDKVKSGETKSVELRQEFICAHSVVLRALGSVGADLFRNYPTTWKEKLAPLAAVNWRKVNKDWENVCIVANSVVSNRQARLATKAYIKRKLSLELTEPERRSLPAITPQSIEEAVARSEVFTGLKQKDRRPVGRACDFAIRFLADRTGVPDAHAPIKDPTWRLDFLARHPKLLEAVRHIHERDANNAITKYFSPGYSSATLYLMATSESDADEYQGNDPRTEESLNWDKWNRACEFWTLLGSTGPSLKPVRTALEALENPSVPEKFAVIAKAWAVFSEGKKVTEEDLVLSYDEEDGVHQLVDRPTLGGIDQGDTCEEEVSDEAEEAEVA